VSDDGFGDAFEDVVEMPEELNPAVQTFTDVAANVANNAIRADPAFGGAIAGAEDVFHAATQATSDMTGDDAGVAEQDLARGIDQVTRGDPGDTWRAIRPDMGSVPEAERVVLDEMGEVGTEGAQIGLGMLSADAPTGAFNSAVEVIEDARDEYREGERHDDLFAERGIPGPADPDAPSPGHAEGPADAPAPEFQNDLDAPSDGGAWDGDAVSTDFGDVLGAEVSEMLASPDVASVDDSGVSFDWSGSDDAVSSGDASFDLSSYDPSSSDGSDSWGGDDGPSFDDAW
jgi:hypothetical protein